jgi:opacity protein-like surface antigen
MTSIEPLVRSELDRRYPRPAGEPDWDNVLQRAAEVAPTLDRRRRRRRLVVALAAAVLAAAAASLALVAPWNGTPGLLQQALAALGSGRYVHAVFQSTSVVRQVDLASGQERSLAPFRIEFVYDTKTGANSVRIVGGAGGLVFGGPSPPNPAISGFATGYRAALAHGRARVVGTTTVYGERAVILRFKTGDGVSYEDVAVSAATHNPLRVAFVNVDPRGEQIGQRTYRVLAIGSSSSPPTLPKPPASTPTDQLSAFALDIRRLEVGTARAAFGHTLVWPGPAVAGATLRSIHLQSLTTTSGGSTSTATPGLELDYRGPRGALTVLEAAKAEAAYLFLTPRYGLDLYPIPAAGQALVACDGCRVAGEPAHPSWRAQLRTHGLYVTIRSSRRDLVVAAARELVPMR